MGPDILVAVALHIAAIACKDEVDHVYLAIAVQVIVAKVDGLVHLGHHGLYNVNHPLIEAVIICAISLLGTRIVAGVVDGDRPHHIERGVELTHRVIIEVIAHTALHIHGIVGVGSVVEILLAGQLLIELLRIGQGELLVVPLHQHHQSLEVVIVNQRPDAGRGATTLPVSTVGGTNHLRCHFFPLLTGGTHLRSHHLLHRSQKSLLGSRATLRIVRHKVGGSQHAVGRLRGIAIIAIGALQHRIAVGCGGETKILVSMQLQGNHRAVGLNHIYRT